MSRSSIRASGRVSSSEVRRVRTTPAAASGRTRKRSVRLRGKPRRGPRPAAVRRCARRGPAWPPRTAASPLHAAPGPACTPCGPAAARPGAVGGVAGQTECGGERAAGDGQGRGHLTGRDARQQGGALGVGAECGDQGRGEHGGGDQRRGQQGAARLLAGDGELGAAAADAPVLLREGESGQPEVLGEPSPQVRVVPVGGAHGAPDVVGCAVFGQQFAQGAADLVLFRGEGGIHRRTPSPQRPPAPDLTVRHVRGESTRCPESRTGGSGGSMPGGKGNPRPTERGSAPGGKRGSAPHRAVRPRRI